MPKGFQKGNELGSKRQTKGGGRPTKTKKEIKRASEELARAYIEEHIKPVLATYGKVSEGYTVKKRLITKAGDVIEFDEFVYDSAILKHYMDRVIPARLPEDKKGNAVPPMVYNTPNLESSE